MINESAPVSGDPLSSEAGLQVLFDPNPLPMWIFDRESLAFLAVNEAAVQKYGWSREEFLKMTVEDIRPPGDPAALRGIRAKTAAESSSGLNGAEPGRHRTKHGRIIDVESTWHRVPVNGRTAVLVVNIDRSEQKRTLERNREQANLLDLAADAIIVRNLDHHVLFWNRGAERLYGWTAAEAIGANAAQLLPGDAEHFAAAADELRENGMWSGQIEQTRKDGRQVIVNSRWTLVRDDRGRPKSVLVINTDVTETKKLESQFLRAQRLEAIGTLASGIAHDLNNVLSPILMSVGILRRELQDESSARMLEIIEGSAERGAGIVKQVLTFARGVDGDRVLIQPKHIVNELSRIMSQTFPRNIDIQTEFPPELWTIMGDATQLHQVLLNLCVNARDAMASGGSLTIAAENVQIDAHFASMNPGAKLGSHVGFRVSDTGCGMSPETMEKIFDPFFTTKEIGQGTGLGLATVVGIVKSHGGFLNVQSTVGVGTTFRVFIPAATEAVPDQKKTEPSSVVGGNGELVLVVDDEIAIRESLVRTLQSHGYEAYTAEDGTDALALYFQRRNDIDVVLTDISMGQMDGVSLVRALRKVNADVRVIVSSGNFHQENTAILTGLGVKTFLHKPYNADKLLSALRSALSEPRRTTN